MNNKRFAILALGLIALMALAACGGGGSSGSGGPAPLAVTITAKDISYDTTSITAKVGQVVTVTLNNVGALDHSFVIDELAVKLENVKGGTTGTVTFTPQKAGTYTFYCSVPGHKQAGMAGTLTVTQ